MTLADRSFRALGTTVRVVAEAPHAAALAAEVEALVTDYDRRLSRFRPDSELCRLNADPRAEVPASPLLRDAVRAALWAARRSAGLVDPTLLDALERAGYVASLAEAEGARRTAPHPAGARPAAGLAARQAAGTPTAAPHPAARWRAVRVDDAAGVVARPPGLRLDLGGSGKGHVADLAAELLAPARRWAIDCGGDVRVGGVAQEVHVAHPDGGEPAARLVVRDRAVATSAVHARAWRRPDGRAAHHLLDPSTGEPAWTGIVAATAIGPTVLVAETRAKMALLGGPEAARRVLARGGGVLVDARGRVELAGPAGRLLAERAA